MTAAVPNNRRADAGDALLATAPISRPNGQLVPQVVLYIRVSTRDQNPDLQLRELREYVERQNWQIAEIYQDTISGAESGRPALDRLMGAARARKFTCLLVWKLDRFGRTLLHCISCIEELQDLSIRFIAITQALDVDRRNPATKFLLHVLAAAAEFERSLILERTEAGKARYRDDFASGRVGKTVHSRSGKDLPPHRPKKVFDREKVIALRTRGLSMRQIAREMSLGLGTVADVIQEHCERSKSTPLQTAGTMLNQADFSGEEIAR